ncbi:unnamed protein product [Phytophthora fragariaefolia]|uniref:Unnamed protein product n=1 Tax=Phytophthora fragariaefolia TaxID=1490495 RepID=A0A9W6Y006_9STRA|nr:unnamed protein product [Phytophthora fragariaefolia]
MVGEFAVRIEVVGTEYRLFPVVHVSMLKWVKSFPDRPQIQLNPDITHRLDFDDALLPEDSWIQDLGEDEFEVPDPVSSSLDSVGIVRVHRLRLAPKSFEEDLRGYIQEPDPMRFSADPTVNLDSEIQEYEDAQTVDPVPGFNLVD